MLKQLIKEAVQEILLSEKNKDDNYEKIDNGMIGKYVIVRCHDAGIHAGVLESYHDRQCVLSESRRLWYWKVKNNSGDFLSSIAINGVHDDSKIGAPIKIHLTENCEIIECTKEAEKSIREKSTYNG